MILRAVNGEPVVEKPVDPSFDLFRFRGARLVRQVRQVLGFRTREHDLEHTALERARPGPCRPTLDRGTALGDRALACSSGTRSGGAAECRPPHDHAS